MQVKKFILVIFIFLISQQKIYTQINITSIEVASTNNAGEGDLYITSDTGILYIGLQNGTLGVFNKPSETVVLSRNGGVIEAGNNAYKDFPLNTTHVQQINSDFYTVLGNGRIRVLKDGTYSITSSLSSTNMFSGTTKYIIGAFKNGNLIGYLSRGFTNLPSVDYWGTSGSLMYSFEANDEIRIRYVINGSSNRNAVFFNIGINRL